MMEEHHSGLLRQYRSRFVQSVEVDRLYPMLVNTKVLSRSETEILDQLPSEEERVGRLLDMLPSKGRLAFESLCLALETTYPHLLTVMFLGSTITHKGSLHSQSTVSSTSTSESDMTEDPRGVTPISPPSMETKATSSAETAGRTGDSGTREYLETFALTAPVCTSSIETNATDCMEPFTVTSPAFQPTAVVDTIDNTEVCGPRAPITASTQGLKYKGDCQETIKFRTSTSQPTDEHTPTKVVSELTYEKEFVESYLQTFVFMAPLCPTMEAGDNVEENVGDQPSSRTDREMNVEATDPTRSLTNPRDLSDNLGNFGSQGGPNTQCSQTLMTEMGAPVSKSGGTDDGSYPETTDLTGAPSSRSIPSIYPSDILDTGHGGPNTYPGSQVTLCTSSGDFLEAAGQVPSTHGELDSTMMADNGGGVVVSVSPAIVGHDTRDYLEAYAQTVPVSQQRKVNKMKLSLKNSFPFYQLEMDRPNSQPARQGTMPKAAGDIAIMGGDITKLINHSVPRMSLQDFSDKEGPSESSSLGDPRNHERSYDDLQEPCTMQQAQVLSKEYLGPSSRSQHDVDRYRNGLHHPGATVNELQLLRQELDETKRALHEAIVDRDRLCRDLEELRQIHKEDSEELEKLWRQNKEIVRQPDSSDMLQKMYDTALEKIDDQTKTVRQLRMRNSQLALERDTMGGEVAGCGDQISGLRAQVDTVMSERSTMKGQLVSCQQQYMKVMRELQISHKDCDDAMKREQVLKKIHTEKMMEYNQVLSVKKDLELAVRRSEDQRKEMAAEYTTVMGERDGVLKENNQLQSDADLERKKREEAEHKIWLLQQDLETSKRRLQDNEQELDIAQRDVENLSDCYWDMLTNKKERGKALKDFEKFKEQRDVARKERMEALDQRDMLLLKYYDAEQQQKAMNNERNLANRDVEQMRGQVDQLQRQLKDALQETAKAKHERDWAFNERHKVVQERESIRTLCDQMRKERDLTFKKLTDSLRKVDDMENQRNKSVRDFQEIRDRMQNQSEREARMRQLIAQHSTDSAIDADYLEWESETVELDCRHLISGNDEFAALGFDVAECPDHNCYPEDCSIYVSKVETGSPAHGKLRVNDCLVRISDVDLSASTREGVQQALVNCQDILVMVVKRRRSHACKPITLTLDISRTSLLILENGVFVSGAISGSQSLRELGIMPGDRIFMVNNTPVENMTSHEVQTLLASCQNPVDITVMRLSSFPGTSSGPPSASPTVDSSDSREIPPSCMSSPLMPSPTELSEGAVPSAFKETSVQTDPERKISREMSFRSAHSREDSRESNGGGAEQGTLKAADWEEAKARHQHDQEPPGWGGEMDGRDEYDLGDPGTLKASDWEEAKQTQHHRRGGAHAKQRSRDEQQHHVRSPPKQDSRQQHRRDLSLSGFPPDYSRTQKRRRGPSKRGDHSEKMDYNSTWPKSRGPPDMLSQVKTDLVTVTPLMNPQTYRDPQQDTTAVAPSAVGSPPKPPSRNSSFHIVHHHSSSGSSAGSRRKNSNTSPPSPGAADAALSPVSPRAPVRNVPPVSRESWSPGSSNGYHPPGSNGSGIAKSSKVVPTRKWDSRGGHSPSSDRPVSMPPYLDPQYPFGQTLPRRLGHHPNQSPPGVPGQSPYTQPTSPRGHRPIHFSSNSNPVTVEDYDSFAPRRAHNPPSAPVQTHFVRDRPRVPSFVVTSKQMNPNEPSISGGAPPAGYNTIPHSPSARDSKGQSASSLPGRRWAGRRAESWDRRDPGKDSDSFQVNKSQRIHIPSRTSVSNSSNSLEIGYTSGRSSPTSPSIPEISSDSSHNSLSETGVVVTTQESGRRDEVRRIEIQKSNEQLGFAIAKGAKDGIFVRSVTPNSLAAEGSMCYGDQILEFNGVNLRQATQSQAASIMGRAWNKVNILVQYNPNKMNDEKDEDATSCSTEPNSPRLPKRPQSDLVSVDGTITPPTPRASRIYENLPNDELLAEDIRRIYMKNTNSVLGVTITGGNAVGIFISDIHSESAAAHQSALRVGDQILEYNSVSFKTATAEQATLELQKPAENIRLYVQYNITKYNSIQGLCGDQLYVRCLVDYSSPEEGHLTFKKDNVLFVNNTVYNHELGIWGAHHVNENGKSTIGGIIPSKRSLSQELMLRPSQSEEKLEDGFRKKHGSHGGRRSSFFRRKKGHRGNSRDSRDFGDGSDVTSLDEIPTYQRVKRLDMRMKRPVVILGPHTDRVASKLVDESPDKFKRVPESKRASVQDLDVDMADSVFPDSPQPEGFYECIPTHIIQDICETGSHCLLDGVAPAICKRLNKANMYPIIIFVKFKSSKQIREQKDPHFLREKVTAKQAKDMFERAQQVEQDYRTLFNGFSTDCLLTVEATVSKDTVAGGNLASMCTRVKEVIDREQKRVLWVPSKLPL